MLNFKNKNKKKRNNKKEDIFFVRNISANMSNEDKKKFKAKEYIDMIPPPAVNIIDREIKFILRKEDKIE